jgi:hypothetical protein
MAREQTRRAISRMAATTHVEKWATVGLGLESMSEMRKRQ